MKKNLLIAIAAFMALTLSACSAKSTANSAAPPPSASSGAASVADYAPDAAEEADDATDGETYLIIDENARKLVEEDSVLSLSLKVDTAAYTNVARYLGNGSLPPADAVRTEELINYFTYDKEMAFTDDSPFSLYTEIAPSPFNAEKYMAMIRVKTQDVDRSELPSSNLTFLIDTSGSMDSYDKLPLLKEAFSLLVETLDKNDRVSIVTYAGNSAVVLDSASGADKDRILSAIQNLDAGGSTAGADGIMTAYELAEKNFMRDGNNRVILATDGDFNVGPSSTGELEKLVSEKRGNGVYLSILGFGTGNIRDDMMEMLSKNGNGNYAYINTLSTAKKVLVDELGSNLFTVADDVKAQVEFNPENVKSYRLIGYENRRLSNKDFADDTKDAGEIGVGTDVVILFELELQNAAASNGLKYASEASGRELSLSDELFEVRIRYKDPGESESKLLLRPVTFGDTARTGSTDFLFACSVAVFGDLLRESDYARDVTIGGILSLAKENLGKDDAGYRMEHVALLEQYQKIVG